MPPSICVRKFFTSGFLSSLSSTWDSTLGTRWWFVTTVMLGLLWVLVVWKNTSIKNLQIGNYRCLCLDSPLKEVEAEVIS